MIKTIGIIAIKREDANKYLENLVGEMKYKDINNLVKSSHNYQVELSDGTRYLSLPCNNFARGHKFTDLYIQCGVEQEFIDCVALPSLMPHDDGSDPTITYFD